MNCQNQIRVQLDNEQALVTSASGRFHVSQKDQSSAVSSCPMELMLGALGACIMMTLNAVAKNKGIDIGNTNVGLDYYQRRNGGTSFLVTLNLDAHFSDRERKILYQSARICEVGKILKGDVQIDYRLTDTATGEDRN